MFRNRAEAAHLLARRFKGRELRDPLVLAIPRGGVVTGAVLARELDAELDVVLARKLRAPDSRSSHRRHRRGRPGVPQSIGQTLLDLHQEYIANEQAHQLGEIARRKALFRAIRPQAPMESRSVIVTDDGIATGATMIAALEVARARNPFELIVAVPVASPDRLPEIRRRCDEVICLLAPSSFWAIGEFYEDFSQVEDSEALDLLRARRRRKSPRRHPTNRCSTHLFVERDSHGRTRREGYTGPAGSAQGPGNAGELLRRHVRVRWLLVPLAPTLQDRGQPDPSAICRRSSGAGWSSRGTSTSSAEPWNHPRPASSGHGRLQCDRSRFLPGTACTGAVREPTCRR